MSHATFTVEEENLICAFDTGSRFALMSDINAAMPGLEEPGMLELAEHVMIKLDRMTEDEYMSYLFCPAYDGDGTEV